jgi:hypothetical protein
VEKSLNLGKRVPLNLKVLPDVKGGIERIARRERRSESNVAEILLEWALNQLDRAGSTLTLIESEAPVQMPRISRETQEMLFTALRTILERAPDAVIEDTIRRITETAGKYSDDRWRHTEKKTR